MVNASPSSNRLRNHTRCCASDNGMWSGRGTAAVIGVILLVFGLWDVIAILRGHWTYDPQYMIGWDLFGILPLEEALFFIAIPLCALLTYEAVGTCLGWIRALRERRAPQNHTTPGASRTDGAEEARHG